MSIIHFILSTLNINSVEFVWWREAAMIILWRSALLSSDDGSARVLGTIVLLQLSENGERIRQFLARPRPGPPPAQSITRHRQTNLRGNKFFSTEINKIYKMFLYIKIYFV